MDRVATAKEMQWCDRTAIARYGIPSIVLMENAGRSAADAIERELGSMEGKLVYVICGKGNNGGDGIVAARHLHNRSAIVKVFLAGKKQQVKGDAEINLRLMSRAIKTDNSQTLQLVDGVTSRILRKQSAPDVVIDAIFGTGFSGAVKGEYEKIIQWINGCQASVASIDIPSGVNADNGEVVSHAVKADFTVTMGLRKVGLLVSQGREYSGKVHVADLGIPQELYARSGIRTWLVQREDVRKILPRRRLDAHKHSVGKIFILAGSKGLTGAAVMSSNSAMRAGAGAVILGIPRSLFPIVAKKVTEVMPHPLEENEDQSIGRKSRTQVKRFVEWADVVVIGPGLGRNEETQELILNLVRSMTKPMLIDADGLNALASDLSVLKKRRSETILTPHTGELSRMIGLSSMEIEGNRVEIARTWARKLNVILVLKGAPTVTATPGGNVFINSTGNPGMATAGSGDVLTGTIAGLWGQHVTGSDAAVSGVFVHGLAGDIAQAKYGEMSLVATDILRALPFALRRVQSKGGK
jgi:hydroxyethylthiazole kinase-like uncharacterized protein yjeF